MRVKLHAIALVGWLSVVPPAEWYLVMPPALLNPPNIGTTVAVDLHAPLSNWVIVSLTKETLEDCEKRESSEIKLIQSRIVANPTLRNRILLGQLNAARCVKFDDPRFNETR